MTTAEMVLYLRENLSVQNLAESVDLNYLNMTDDTLGLYLKTATTRLLPMADDPSLAPPDYHYLIILYAKKDLYFTLATATAPFVDMGAEGAYIKLGDRYNHYMALIKQVNDEIKSVEDTGLGSSGYNTLTSFNVLLSNRYYTQRSYALSVPPAVYVRNDGVTSTTANLSWYVMTPYALVSYRIYVSTSSMYDSYISNSLANELPVVVINDTRQQSCRLENLSPGTTYYIVVSVDNIHGVKGFKQIAVTTTGVSS